MAVEDQTSPSSVVTPLRMKFFTVQKIERLLREVEAAVYREIDDTIRNWKAIEVDVPGAEAPDFDDSGWRDFRLGDAWGGYDIVAWFRTRVCDTRDVAGPWGPAAPSWPSASSSGRVKKATRPPRHCFM